MAEKNLHIIFNRPVSNEERERFADIIKDVAELTGFSIYIEASEEEETFEPKEGSDNA